MVKVFEKYDLSYDENDNRIQIRSSFDWKQKPNWAIDK